MPCDLSPLLVDWVGCDISKDMIHEAVSDNGGAGSGEITGDFVHSDMGLGLPFRPASFDGVISVSALQWLCYSDSSESDPRVRLNRFFSSLYGVLKRDGRACLQFYPENPEQAALVSQVASRVGFTGGVVVDYPNSSKAKKYYLCLSFERSYTVPTAMVNGSVGNTSSTVSVVSGTNSNERRGKKTRLVKHSKEWVLQKKDSRRRKGMEVKADSKFSGRRRPTKF